jgi:hypothetical protein
LSFFVFWFFGFLGHFKSSEYLCPVAFDHYAAVTLLMRPKNEKAKKMKKLSSPFGCHKCMKRAKDVNRSNK